MGAVGLQPLRIWLDSIRRIGRSLSSVSLRALTVIAIALGLTSLFSATPFYQNIQSLMSDWSHNLVAGEQDYSDVMLIDADQETFDILARDYGQWPYGRDAIATLIHYVANAGAAVIVLEMPLELSTDYDNQLTAALLDAGNVVIGASGLNTSLPRPREYQQTLERFGWRVADEVPSRRWMEVSLPNLQFLQRSVARSIGVQNLTVQERDALARHFYLLHQGRNVSLPTLSLAAYAVKAEITAPAVERVDGELQLGEHRWPIDQLGRVWPLVPPNIDQLPSMRMWQILLEAANDPTGSFFAEELTGKVVFIGSTAAGQASLFKTPQGLVPGLRLQANFYDALNNNRLLVPPQAHWNVLLVAIALLLPLLSLRKQFSNLIGVLTISSLTALLVTLVFLLLLFVCKQLSNPLFAYLVLLLGTIVLLVFRAKYHVDAGQSLYYEKLAAEGANDLKTEFLAQMTHELRTPLTSVIGFNRLLGEGTFDGRERLRERDSYRKIIDNNCQHLLQLINNILDHSKLVAGQMLIETAVTDVPALLTSTAHGLLPLADEKGLEVRLTIDERMPARLLVDEFRVKQVLLNIMGNALKFTRHGFVHMSAGWDNGWLEISIEDTGCGMPELVLSRVFESFQQADVSVAKQYGGTGLGLSISRDLVQLMGGRLVAESQVDVGSTFTLRVPAAYSRPEERNLREIPQVVEPPLDLNRIVGARVLVADDTADIRALVKVYLKGAKVQVDTAEDGKEAVAKALADRPDLVLMDMEMPVMDGYEAIALLRSRGFKAPIVGFTAHGSDEIQKTIRDLGADICVRKPVSKTQLLNAVARVLIRYQEMDSHRFGPEAGLYTEPATNAGGQSDQ